MSTARFILDETRALPWLARAIDHHESGQTPPEDEHLPEISEHYCPEFDDDGAETYSLIASARDAGIITGPSGTEVYFDYSRSEYEGGYVWLMYVKGPGSLKLSTYYAKMRHLGDGGASSGAQAALAVLREAEASANELLDDLDAFVSARAEAEPPGGQGLRYHQLPVDALDDIERTYGARNPPRRRVLPETLGLALVVLVNGNTAPDQAAWLADPEVHNALCAPAEAFAAALSDGTGHAPRHWRGGGLAGLRRYLPGAVHQDIKPWPPSQGSGRPELAGQFWIEEQPLHASLLADLHGHPNIATAFDTLTGMLTAPPSRRILASWDSTHERPANTSQLREELTGRRLVHLGRDRTHPDAGSDGITA